jgi:hypothetical protein
VLAAVAVGCAIISGARLGISGLNTVWAEDGQVVYADALNNLWRADIEPYRGYMITGPHIVGSVVALFPVSWVAAAFAIADAIVIGLLAALVYRACGEHIRNPWLRAIPSVTVAACPVGQETWGAVIALWFPMYFVGIIVLLWNPRRPMAIAIGTMTVVVLTLSSPFGWLLAPIAVVRIFAFARDRGSVIPLATLVGTAWQSAEMLIFGGRPTGSAIVPGAIRALYLKDVAGPVLYGAHRVAGQRPGAEVLIATLAALALVAASGRRREFALAALALAYSIGYFAVLMVLSGADIGQNPAGRYSVGSFLLLAFALVVLLDSVLPGGAARRATHAAAPARRRPADAARIAAVVVSATLTGCLVWSVATGWHVPNPARQRPTWSAALASARAQCDRGARTVQVPITPRNPPYWHVELTCAQLGAGGR